MPKTSLIPTPKPITDATGAESAIRQHCQSIEGGVRLSIAAMIALGATLKHAKNALGYAHGGDRKGSSSSDLNLIAPAQKREPWPKLVERFTGKSYFWCQTLQKAAERLTAKLAKSDLDTDRAAAAILAAPPAQWSAADYEGLAAVLAGRFDAATFSGLLGELGLIGPSHPGDRLNDYRASVAASVSERTDGEESADDLKPAAKKPGRVVEAQLYFGGIFKTLFTAREANPDKYRQRLHALPMRARDPRTEVGLLDLQSEYKQHLAEIESAIEARSN